ncbi:MAG: DUF3795 domain-containing protein [Promethearchaeota archaeon]
MVDIKKELLAPCGLYCGVCAIYIADRDGKHKFKEAIKNSHVYKAFVESIEDVKCKGCQSEDNDDIFGYCKECKIRDCVHEKKIESCYKCEDVPCKWLQKFPIPVGRKVIMRALPYWREHGTQKWIEHEELRYRCPECGNHLYRGAIKCNKCKKNVSID